MNLFIDWKFIKKFKFAYVSLDSGGFWICCRSVLSCWDIVSLVTSKLVLAVLIFTALESFNLFSLFVMLVVLVLFVSCVEIEDEVEALAVSTAPFLLLS